MFPSGVEWEKQRQAEVSEEAEKKVERSRLYQQKASAFEVVKTANLETVSLPAAEVEGATRSEMFAMLFVSATWGKISMQVVRTTQTTYRSLSGTLLPLEDHTPSTHAPFLPTTTRTKRSSSSSYSILACKRETLLRGPRSTSI